MTKNEPDNPVLRIKQFLRLALTPNKSNDSPYIAIALPEEKIVRTFEDIINQKVEY